MSDPEARAFPELQALGFWMRKAAVMQMKREFEALQSRDCVLVPRGLVFHIPPGNVDTIFLYSWALSFLTGNGNVIRLSSKESPQTAVLVRLLQKSLAQNGEGNGIGNTVILRYGHDAAINEAISALADVRVIWGGDDTIRRIRQAPLAPHAKEITFPDRTSLAALKADAWLGLTEPAKRELAERFFNDTYWFDQMACSSPRRLIWCGEAADNKEASRDFLSCLREHIIGKSYTLSTGTVLKKLAFSYGSILDTSASDYSEYGNELTVITVDTLTRLSRQHCGGGLLFQVFLRSLGDLTGSIDRSDQTLTTFGFDNSELRTFAGQLNGKGIDRIVPIGTALNFSRFWDGYDLLQELTRRVHISTSGFRPRACGEDVSHPAPEQIPQ
jgi:hypothetical protein